MVECWPANCANKQKETLKVSPELQSCPWDDRYAVEQLRQRHQDLESLDFEYQSTGMTLCEYRSCRISLLQAIDELESLLRLKSEGSPTSEVGQEGS